jgi:hypothetical protein
MNKHIRNFTIILLATLMVNRAQAQAGEKVNWNTPALYTAEKITFHTGKIKMECTHCQYLEIKTQAGITGIFIQGAGHFEITEKKISDNFSNCLVRFNPAEAGSSLTISGKTRINDKKFYIASMQVLNKDFRHCYHKGMNAIIPEPGEYALNFNTVKYGDFLASFNKEQNIFYNYTKNLKYD